MQPPDVAVILFRNAAVGPTGRSTRTNVDEGVTGPNGAAGGRGVSREYRKLSTETFNRSRTHEGSLALLALAGALLTTAPAVGSDGDGGGRPLTPEVRPTAAAPRAVLPATARLSAEDLAEQGRPASGQDGLGGGRTVRPVQYRTAMRPVYSTPPAPAPAPVATAAPFYLARPPQVVTALTMAAPTLRAPMMAAPMFAQPVMSAINGWQSGAYPGYAQPAQAQPAMSYGGGGDPYGFTQWLNSVRAQYGLRPVAYDAGLSGWASANNSAQQSRGLGHHVMGPARRQNSAIGSAGSIGSQWMNSPAHRAALLDPSISSIGISGSGQYWTFNAR